MANELDYELGQDEQEENNLRAAQDAFQIFLNVANMADTAPSEEDCDSIVDELYAANGDIFDPNGYACAWRSVRAKREEAARREAEFAEKEHRRQQEREDFLRPSNRAELARELSGGQQHNPDVAAFVPARQYTEAELDRMSADEYRRNVLGITTIEDRQEKNSGYTRRFEKVKPEQVKRHSSKPTFRNLKKRLRNF